jgi:hypothetical protein
MAVEPKPKEKPGSATYVQTADATVEALQWQGGLLSDYALPPWFQRLAPQATGNDTIQLPNRSGRTGAVPGDWIVFDGEDVSIVPDAAFRARYKVKDPPKDKP